MWGGGWLASNGAKDFAGGVVLHATAGSSCLVACKLLGPRRGHQKDQESGGFPYSNIVTSTIGASILWVRHPHATRVVPNCLQCIVPYCLCVTTAQHPFSMNLINFLVK
jgi:hypothetical protein